MAVGKVQGMRLIGSDRVEVVASGGEDGETQNFSLLTYLTVDEAKALHVGQVVRVDLHVDGVEQ